ncbi:S-adenosyl-L-methionine-dependent methyltransferase [Pelagophyceae sp. CCMP2097]|nr:S-adenosyl-L-methionine-dependent methyltransferase [Pelagophyceae sp. CCMP2097]|mmetsp:Transcript_11989/g.41438  ORF Transcript_11989/g.41438 Transcript_11989/m.41438 type:complete len:328 (+) Transcript_11989:50-1033(+)
MAALTGEGIDAEGWFAETEVMWPGQKFCLKVGAGGVLHRAKSDFQNILVFESETYGRVLALDGVIQVTERDEFAYQEMMVHLPLFAHAEPKRVLIVGGGDGGVLREVARHGCVTKIDMCEIDPMVCEVSKLYFRGTLATTFDDERLTLVYADAAEYLRELITPTAGATSVAAVAAAKVLAAGDFAGYDVIIVDSSDPVGPAESLFKPDFYECMRAALAPGGITCTQGECMWLHLPLIASVISACGEIFPSVEYAYTTIPSYPSGQIGFIMCSLNAAAGMLVKPLRAPAAALQDALRYYSPDMHAAAFVLPQFAAKAIAAAKADTGKD